MQSHRALAHPPALPVATYPMLEVGHSPPRQRLLTACVELGRPSAAFLAGRRETRPSMRADGLLLPTTSITSTRAFLVPGISSKLALRPWTIGLHPCPRDRGMRRFTTPYPLRWVPRVDAQHGYSARSRAIRTFDTSVASSRQTLRFRSALHSRKPRSYGRPLREDGVSQADRRCLPSIGDARALTRADADLDCGHVRCFRNNSALRVRSIPTTALHFSVLACCRDLGPRPRNHPARKNWIVALLWA